VLTPHPYGGPRDGRLRVAEQWVSLILARLRLAYKLNMRNILDEILDLLMQILRRIDDIEIGYVRTFSPQPYIMYEENKNSSQ